MRRRKNRYSDTSGLVILTETDEEFIARMKRECDDYRRHRNSELIAEQLLIRRMK